MSEKCSSPLNNSLEYLAIGIVLLLYSGSLIAGRPFDYLGYTAIYLIKAVAKEANKSNDVDVRLVKSEFCTGLVPCSAVEVRFPLNHSGLLEKFVVALAEPCEYSKKIFVAIKNPEISTRKTKPVLDGKEVFCRESERSTKFVMVISDSIESHNILPISIIINRKGTVRTNR